MNKQCNIHKASSEASEGLQVAGSWGDGLVLQVKGVLLKPLRGKRKKRKINWSFNQTWVLSVRRRSTSLMVDTTALLRSVSLVLHCDHCAVAKMETKGQQTGERKWAAEFSPSWGAGLQPHLWKASVSLSLCFHLGWEGDRVGFLHYQQSKWNFSKILYLGQMTVGWGEGLTGVTGGSGIMG